MTLSGFGMTFCPTFLLFQKSQKKSKKYLTTFLKSGIKLKNFNLIVLIFHKPKKKGGDDWDLGNGQPLQYFKKEVKD
jgi:hypothetical protein